MATQVRLKVRKVSKGKEESGEADAGDVLETVQEIVSAIGEGIFDPYIDVLWKAFDDRIRKSQEEDGDGEVPTRDRAEKLRPMRVEREPVTPGTGRHYRIRGEKYMGAVVMFIEMAGFNNRGAAMVLVEGVVGNSAVKTGQRYRIPLIALEEIPDVKSKPLPNVQDAPKCRKCGGAVNYSGRGRPRNFCDNCLNVKP